MAYSPSVQYGYYKRLEFSLFVFFSFFFLFLKFFFATLEKNFLLFFFSLQNSFHADFNPVEFVARMNNLVNSFYFIPFFCSSAVNGSRIRRVHLKVYFVCFSFCFGQNSSVSSLLFPPPHTVR